MRIARLNTDGARLFLTCWILFSAHFATNVVREHYPAFTLAEHGSLRLDEYQGFHSDIFVHRDGHSYVNNNVGASVVAALPLLLFDPVLDRLEELSLRRLEAAAGGVDASYRTGKPMRREFFRLVRERGLDLRFGAATAVTSVLLMAPLSALMVLLTFRVLLARGLARGRALGLALLFAFATPVFLRTSHLNHNMIAMYGIYGAFLLLWRRPQSSAARFWAGVLSGYAVFADYGSAIPLAALWAYLVFPRVRADGAVAALRRSLPFVAGSALPLAALCLTQWMMFGNPLLPAQHWMADATYTGHGWRGLDWPAPDLLLSNLFHPAYGLLPFAPLLALAFVPTLGDPARRVLPATERRLLWWLFAIFLLFCSANQYARMQWNTGFRYLLPLVPLLFLAAADHLARLSRRALIALSVPVLLHSWVLTMMREPVHVSWKMFVESGVQLPWLAVLRQTSPPDHALLSRPWLPAAVLLLCLVPVAALWALPRARGPGSPSAAEAPRSL